MEIINISHGSATEVYSKATDDALYFRYKFHNGYGASVVRHKFSYGGTKGLFELAVLVFDKNDTILTGKICYTTPITGDVLGWLTPDEVTQYLKQIADLPSVI